MPVAGAELVALDAEVVGQLELRQVLAWHAEEVVHRLVADRKLAALLETESLVEGHLICDVLDVVVKLPVATVPVVSARSLDLRTVGRKTRGGPLNISSQKGGNQPGLNYS